MSSTTNRWLLLALLVLGLALRVGVAWKQGLNTPPEPGSDAHELDTYAWNVAQGRGYRGLSPDVADQDHVTAYRPPGASLVWAGVYKVAGHRYDIVRLVHCVLGAATIGFVYAIGRRCFNEPVARLAAVIWAIWPFGLLYSSQLLAEALGTFWLLWYVLVALQFAEKPSGGRALLAGALLGVTLLTRPSTVLMLPLAGLWALWQFRRQPRALAWAVGIPFIAVAMLVPWTVRNWQVFGKFIPISTMGGSALLQGNNDFVATNPVYYGFSIWDTKINHDIARQLKEPNDEYERDKVASRIAVEWLKKNPDKWWNLAQAKFRRSWTPFLQQNSRTIRAIYFASWGPVLLLFALSFFPTLIEFLRQGRAGWLIHLVCLHYALNSVVFYALARYRFPIEGLCIILACAGLVWAYRRFVRQEATPQ